MGRVVKVYPGPDGQVRAVDVRSNDKTFQHAARTLILLVEQQPLPTTGEHVQPCRPLTAGSVEEEL